ncbi:uncharacterized protein MONBRDRAFT_39401, partial [Monosiga brevicollis MX1]
MTAAIVQTATETMTQPPAVVRSLDDLRNDLLVADHRCEQAFVLLQNRDATIAQLQEQLAAEQHARILAEQQLEDHRTNLDVAHEEMAALRAAREAWSDLTQASENMRAHIATLEETLDSQTRQLQETQLTVKQLTQERTELSTQISQLRQANAEHDTVRAADVAQLQAARQQLANAQEELQ